MKTLLAICLFSSVAFASPQKKAPNWFCFITVDSNAQRVEACERTEVECNEDIAGQDLSTDKVHCVAAAKATVFTIRHKNDGRTETFALPETEACQYLSQTIVNEDIDLVTTCKVTQ